MAILPHFVASMRLLESWMLKPTLYLLREREARWHNLAIFLTLAMGLIVLGLSVSGLWWLLALLFWLCLSVALLNRRINREKRAIIDGRSLKDFAQYITYYRILRWPLITSALLLLLLAMVLLLRQLAIVWGDAIFQPPTKDLIDWGRYALDLFWKATLFDIPEIYRLNIIEIEHVGFWGSTVVFMCRIIILALLLGAIWQWLETRQTVADTVYMAEYHRDIAQKRLSMILELYPHQVRRISRRVFGEGLTQTSREVVLQALGQTKRAVVLPTLEKALSEFPQEAVKVSALKGMAMLGRGNPAFLSDLLHSDSVDYSAQNLQREACLTLAAWKDPQSLSLLGELALSAPRHVLRLSAIEALGGSGCVDVLPVLIALMLDGTRPKDERFTARSAIVRVGQLPEELRHDLHRELQNSPHPDNRRFAAMILGEVIEISELSLFCAQLAVEQDQDTRIYLLKGIGNIIDHKGEIVFATTNNNIFSMLSQEIPPISSAFQAVKSVAYREEEPSFVRVAAIHALGDFSWAFANQLISDQSLQDLLKQLASSADIQVADAALDIAQNLEWPEDHKPMMRSECVTAAGVTDIKWKRPKRPQPEHLREQAPNICDAHQQVIPEHLRVIATTYIGQNATLYRVLDLRDRREKCLKIANNNHPETQAAFATEINFLSDSNHPNILTLLEAYPALTLPAFVSPWLGNVTLLRYHQEQMRQGQSWQLNQFLEVMEQLCKATQYAHEKGWYHADLKPENIIWQSDGRVMICDWNSAKHKHTTHTSPSMIGGTPYYMAPEQLQINGQILDHRIDIYSIGIIAYELLSGFLPLGVAPPTLRDIRPELPIALDPILAKATALHANKRQSTAIALWYELTSASTTS